MSRAVLRILSHDHAALAQHRIKESPIFHLWNALRMTLNGAYGVNDDLHRAVPRDISQSEQRPRLSKRNKTYATYLDARFSSFPNAVNSTSIRMAFTTARQTQNTALLLWPPMSPMASPEITCRMPLKNRYASPIRMSSILAMTAR